MANYDNVYIQAIGPRTMWVKPLDYEVNIDETKGIIEALINEPLNPKAAYFGTQEEAKAMIELKIKTPQAVNKGKKRISKMQNKTPLLLTKGKGEDVKDDEEIEQQESEEEEEPLKEKGKVTITKPAKIVVLSRRSYRKKNNKEGEDVIFKKPPPTFEERIKAMESGSCM